MAKLNHRDSPVQREGVQEPDSLGVDDVAVGNLIIIIIIIFIAVFYHRVLNAQITGNRDIQTSSQTTKHSYVYSRKRKD